MKSLLAELNMRYFNSANGLIFMATLKNLPKICPSCGKRLSVHAMHCNGCQTHIEGNYSLPVMMQLSAPDQQFVLDFVKSSGSLKEMAHKLGLSYPTVRNRLDDIISQLNKFESDEQDS